MALYTFEGAARALPIATGEKVNDYPEDSDIAASISNNRWMQHMIDSLPHIFDVAKQVCLLWTMVDKQSPYYKESLLKNQSEINFQEKEPSGGEEDGYTNQVMPDKQFLIHETIYAGLPLYGQCLGPVFFSLPGMMDVFIEKVVKNWVHLPNYRMRKVWRAVVKSFSFQCPAKYYETILGPFLAVSIEQMFQRLSKEWPRIQESMQAKEFVKEVNNEYDQPSELLELSVIHNLSKEVIKILVYMCRMKREKQNQDNVKAIEGTVHMIGNLGEFLLTYPQTNVILITTFFTALTWPDATVMERLCSVVTAIVRKMFVPENPINPEIPNQMMLHLLKAIQVHSTKEIGLTYIINATMSVYLHLRQQYPGIVKVMMMVPSCQEEALKRFDIAMFVHVENINESTKRRRFRKLVEGAIGEKVNQLHTNAQKIQDLLLLASRD